MRGAGAAAGLVLMDFGLGGCNKQSESGTAVKGAGDMIAYCGLDCSKCQIYLATREKDPKKQREMREGIARYNRQHFDPKTRVKDITDCDGCTVKNGRLYSGCQKCEVRKCARQKGLKNCAYCKAYACKKLSKLYDSGGVDARAKKRLDAIKARL
jgi:hypothetical protein